MNRPLLRTTFLWSIVFSLGSIVLPAGADVFVVDPYGTGDYPTIQAAIDAAADGDVVELTDGTFTGAGNRDVDFLGKALAVRSASGNPGACVINCQGSIADPHRAFSLVTAEPPQTSITGITVIGSYVVDVPYGGAVLCENASFVTIRSCVFESNFGGCIVLRPDCGATVDDCVFRHNTGVRCGAIRCRAAAISVSNCQFLENAVEESGAAIYGYATNSEVSDCVFRGNSSGYWGGAIVFMASEQVAVRDCLFEENVTPDWGAFMCFITGGTVERCTFARNAGAFRTAKSSRMVLTNCTFWGNGSPLGTLILSDGGTVLENCIVAADTQGPAIYTDGDATLRCCDLHGNEGGDWVGRIAVQYGTNGNICEDPQLCAPMAGDFTLRETSPCAPFTPPNPECDLIGAWPVGCGPSAVTPEGAVTISNWGTIKALYR